MQVDLPREPHIIGIEIGGTKLQAGVGFGNGVLTEKIHRQVNPAQGAAGIRHTLVAMVAELMELAGLTLDNVARIGIGFGGPVDVKRGLILNSFQIEGWRDFPLADWAREQWGLPVFIENDASTAGLAEVISGNGQGVARVFYMTIGSGIGGGWIVDGRIDAGQGLGGAEVGHMWLPDPRDGAPAELELICSGWSIGQRARELAAEQPTMMLEMVSSLQAIDAKIVYAAAEQRDTLANQILRETCQTLALAISNIVTLVHPERIIIGGGVSLMGPLFWDTLREQAALRMLPLFAPTVEIVPAKLGEDVVLVGALCLGQT